MHISLSNCPHCGGTMKMHKGFIECQYCGGIFLTILEAKVDDRFDAMSPQEFADHVRSMWKTYYINTGTDSIPQIEEFDIDVRITNKLIRDAKVYLQNGEYTRVINTLNEISGDYFIVNRLRFLASFRKKNEGEFITDEYYLESNRYYRALINSADEASTATYRAIAKLCRENRSMRTEIESGMIKLLTHQMYDDALTFANMMCNKYPFTARSWGYRLIAKKKLNSSYNGNTELSIMDQCLDHDKVIRELFGSLEDNLIQKKKKQSSVSGIGIISAIIMFLIELALVALVNPIFNNPKAGVPELLFGIILCLIGFVMPVVSGISILINLYRLWKSVINFIIVRSNKKYLPIEERNLSNPFLAVIGLIMVVFVFIFTVKQVPFFWYGK